MDIKKILFATDAKDHTLGSNIKTILSMQQLNLNEIIFLRNSPSGDIQKELSDTNIKSIALIEKKISPSKILSIAEKEMVDLIIIDLTSKSLNHSMINKSKIPMLFINDFTKKTERENENLFKHAVYATDWSPKADKAFNYIIGLKQIIGELEIVNVINKKLTIKDMRNLKEKLAKTRKKCLDEQINAEAHIYAGKTADEIILAAKDYKATIIVMGGESKNPFIKDLFLKNPSNIVTQESTLPVLVIP